MPLLATIFQAECFNEPPYLTLYPVVSNGFNDTDIIYIMADEAEVLDWGGEEDEQYRTLLFTSIILILPFFQAEEPEDATQDAGTGDHDDVVSIGGEDDDMQELAAFQSLTQEDSENEASPFPASMLLPLQAETVLPPRREEAPDSPPSMPASPSRKAQRRPSPSTRPSTQNHKQVQSRPLKAPLTHALPAKPMFEAPSFLSRTQPSSNAMSASVMSDRRGQEKESTRKLANGSSRTAPSEPLPSGWEIRYSSSKGDQAGEPYYYDFINHVSQWERPTLNDDRGKGPAPRARELDRSGREDSRPDSRLARGQSMSDLRSARRADGPLAKGRNRSRSASLSRDIPGQHRTATGRSDIPRRPASPPYEEREPRIPSQSDAFGASSTFTNRRDSPSARSHRRKTELDEPPARIAQRGNDVIARDFVKSGDSDRARRGAESDREGRRDFAPPPRDYPNRSLKDSDNYRSRDLPMSLVDPAPPPAHRSTLSASRLHHFLGFPPLQSRLSLNATCSV